MEPVNVSPVLPHVPLATSLPPFVQLAHRAFFSSIQLATASHPAQPHTTQTLLSTDA